MTTTDGVWLSIIDYSNYKKVSISTIRRHLKSNVLRYKEENGKYLIYVPSVEKIKSREIDETMRLRLEIEFLKSQMRFVQVENDELRMLVNIYEEKQKQFSKIENPPELPGQQ